MTDDEITSALGDLYYDTDTQSYRSMSAPTEESNSQSEMDVGSEAGLKEEEETLGSGEEEYIPVVSDQRSRWMGWVS